MRTKDLIAKKLRREKALERLQVPANSDCAA
jgi:hypothetical protein